MPTRVTSTVMDRTISTSSYIAGGVTAAGGAMSLNNIALLAGIVFAALTFILNVWYQRRKYRLEQQQADIAAELAQLDREFHEARMASLVENVCEAVHNLSDDKHAED